MNLKIICVLCLLIIQLETRHIADDYTKLRNRLLREEKLLSLGGNIILSTDEHEANDVLMQLKRKEIEETFHDPQHYNISRHYFSYKDYVEKSNVFQIIRKMPKGAALHLHSTFMLDADTLIELTYEDHLYVCYHSNNIKFRFSNALPTLPCPVDWKLLSELRDTSDNVTLFDENIKRHFTLPTDDEHYAENYINEVWKRFESVHATVKSLIAYKPVRELYFYKVLEKFYADNVMYLEFRSGLGSLHELDGTKYEKMYSAKLYRNVTRRFIEDHPDFIGVKIIVTCYRGSTPERVLQALNLAKAMKEELPDLFAGFDLVGQEDKGRPLMDFLPILRENKNDVNYYFHAGETVWFGSQSDENLVDAILLDSKRIGHAYSLQKHPSLMKMVLEKDIALEVNVISNAVLSLVRDVRNHPLATYLALGMPVVLSSDDPSAWGADPLTHDFYVSFVAVASKQYDIRMLKQLALNSIKYSALNVSGKERLLSVFTDRWSKFIKELKGGKEDTMTIGLETYTIEPR